MKGIFIILAAGLLVNSYPHSAATAQVAEIAGAASTKIALDNIFSGVDNLIAKARAEGDYLLARAGAEARNAIDAWKAANGSLLDKAFNDLDKASQDLFLKTQALISRGNQEVGANLENARQITENANQIIESIPTQRRTYVLRFYPRIFPPNNQNEFFTFTIRGVNLDGAQPSISLNGKQGSVTTQTQQEVQFKIPTSAVTSDNAALALNTAELSYTVPSENWLKWLTGRRDEIKRSLSFVVLPKDLGSFNLNYKRTVTREEEKPHTVDLGQFKATNQRVYKTAAPPAGYRWVLEKPLNVDQGSGEAGHCDGVDFAQTNPQGVVVFARLDQIHNWRYPSGADGYVNCSISGTVVRTVEDEISESPDSGPLTWTSDLPIEMKPKIKSISLTVKTFDRRERAFNGTGTDKFYDVDSSASGLILRPKVPNDID